MSSNRKPTLATALQLDGASMRDKLADVARECSRLEARAKAGAFIMPRFWKHVGGELEVVALDKLNAFSVVDVMAQGWVTAQELLEYTDPSKHPPGERNVVDLGRWKRRHPFKVTAELLVEGGKVGEVELDITFELAVDALSLAVVDGCIASVALGQAEVSATVEYDNKTLKELSLRKIDIPGEHQFVPPIPIAADRYSAAVSMPREAAVALGVHAEPVRAPNP